LNSQRVLRWRLYIEEFGPKFHYVKGPDNVLADAFSRVPTKHSEILQHRLNLPATNGNDSFYSLLEEEELLDCFLNHPSPYDTQNPLDLNDLAMRQMTDLDLIQAQQDFPLNYQMQQVHGVNVLCFIPGPNEPWKIAIPTASLTEVIRWFHQYLNHAGSTRLFNTINNHYWHPHLRRQVNDFVSKCDTCQRYKLIGRSYGKLPELQATVAPWTEVAVDLIGPWIVDLGNNQFVTFMALTMIDPVTGLAELVRINNKTSEHIAMLFENEWLARYPRPECCIHDNGGEFTGWAFQRILQLNQIKDVPTTVKNPQSNAICERMHQTVGNVLRTLLHVHRPTNVQQITELVDTALSTTMHAIRSTVHNTLQMSPGAVVFNRNMLLNIPLIADLHQIHARRQLLINEDLRRANNARLSHDYQVNEMVMIKEPDPSKMEAKSRGPFQIVRVHANGTVTLQTKPNVTERINIRRIKPYRS